MLGDDLKQYYLIFCLLRHLLKLLHELLAHLDKRPMVHIAERQHDRFLVLYQLQQAPKLVCFYQESTSTSQHLTWLGQTLTVYLLKKAR